MIDILDLRIMLAAAAGFVIFATLRWLGFVGTETAAQPLSSHEREQTSGARR